MLGVVTLALNLYTFKRVTYPGFVAEHRFSPGNPPAARRLDPAVAPLLAVLVSPAASGANSRAYASAHPVCLIAPVGHHSVGSVRPSSAALAASLSHPCRTASCKATDRARRARKPSRRTTGRPPPRPV